MRECVYKVFGGKERGVDVQVQNTAGVPKGVGLDCHPVLAFLPARSPEMPKPAALPFALHSPRFHRGLCLGFPGRAGAGQAGWRAARGPEPSLFPLSLFPAFGTRGLEGVERMPMSRVPVLRLPAHSILQRWGSGTGAEARWHPRGCLRHKSSWGWLWSWIGLPTVRS